MRIDSKVASPVWWSIALHLDCQPEEISAEQDLRADLRLDGLDLALIVMRAAEWLRVDLPPSIVDDARTVGDLARAVVRVMADLDEDGRPTLLPPQPRSGTHRIAPDPSLTRAEGPRRRAQ